MTQTNPDCPCNKSPAFRDDVYDVRDVPVDGLNYSGTVDTRIPFVVDSPLPSGQGDTAGDSESEEVSELPEKWGGK